MKQLFLSLVSKIESKLRNVQFDGDCKILSSFTEDGSTQKSWKVRLPDGKVLQVFISVDRIS